MAKSRFTDDATDGRDWWGKENGPETRIVSSTLALILVCSAAWSLEPVTAAPAAAPAVAPPGTSITRPSFAGLYDFRAVRTLNPSKVSATVIVHFHNYSGIHLTGATLSLCEGPLGRVCYGDLTSSVAVPARSMARVTGTIMIPQAEILRWQSGSPPNLVLRFVDAQGRIVTQPVDVVRYAGLGSAK